MRIITTISYELKKRTDVVISIYNLLGQKLKIFGISSQPVGVHRVQWSGEDADGKEVSSGIYFYRIEAGEFIDSKKMILLK